MLRDALPIVMVRNESRFIQAVLRPLISVFKTVVVGDTGSNDGTDEIVSSMPGVDFIQFGPLSAPDLGKARGRLARRVLALGHKNVFLVDGDELYNEYTLNYMMENDFPDERCLVFTCLVTLDEDEDGVIWEMDNKTSRTAIFRASEEWNGAYPFESPKIFSDRGPFYYYEAPEGYRYHGAHLHRLRRSTHDGSVVGRVAKQKQFCLQNIPSIKRTIKFDLAAWEQGKV